MIDEKILLPRLAAQIVMPSAGFVMAISFGGVVGLVLGVFGVLGLLWLVVGLVALIRRSRSAIRVTSEGIEIPAFTLFQRTTNRVFLERAFIAKVVPNESLKGRLVEICLVGGESFFLQIRNYCEIDDFMQLCRGFGLPVDERK